MLFLQPCRRNPDDFPAAQLFFLAIVRLAEPIALTSIFPYAWALVRRFNLGDDDNASFHAGLLISSFAFTEALMGMFWGGLSDRVGRKPVLLLGCLGTTISMLIVGFSTNIWVALAGRCLGGLLNGNIGVLQTMVGELVTKPEHQPRAYTVLPFVWSIGTIIGPAIGGTFADPHESFPAVFPAGSLMHTFPYLLPNLICAVMLLFSIVLGYFFLEETHTDVVRERLYSLPSADLTLSVTAAASMSEETPLLETSDAIKMPAVDLRAETYGTLREAVARMSHDQEHPAPAGSMSASETSPLVPRKSEDERCAAECAHNIFSRRILAPVLSLAIFTYHSMTFDHLLPIFLEDERAAPSVAVASLLSRPAEAVAASVSPSNPLYSPGGLGLSVQTVGMIMAVNGVIALFIQAVVFPPIAERLGVYRLFIWLCVLHPLCYLILPMLSSAPDHLIFPAIYFCLTVRTVFAIMLYPLLLILIKEAAPSSAVLGRVNGLAASAGAACRMAAPPVAGLLYTVGSRVDCTALAWLGSAAVAFAGSAQCFCIERPRRAADDSEGSADPSHTVTSDSKVAAAVTITTVEESEREV